jgi:hypothetical protein
MEHSRRLRLPHEGRLWDLAAIGSGLGCHPLETLHLT